jgi:DNA-binding CsgD family transcriptional regulator
LPASHTAARTGGQKPKLTPRQARIAQEMYDETGPDGKRRYTVAQIAADFGVTRPTIYRHLACLTPTGVHSATRAQMLTARLLILTVLVVLASLVH